LGEKKKGNVRGVVKTNSKENQKGEVELERKAGV